MTPVTRPALASALAVVLALHPAAARPALAQDDISTRAAQAGAVCHGGTSGGVGEPRAGDGVPDPAGRIAYGVVTSNDPLFGPIASLYAVDPDGSDRVLLLDCDTIRPSWSPDGSRLAFTLRMADGSWQVATMAADGSDLQVVTSGPGIHEIPSWAPDGSWLAYDFSPLQDLEDPAFRTTIWRIGADGSDPALLGDPEAFDTEPRMSPDGTRVAFVRWYPDDGWTNRVILRDIETGEERPLTSQARSFEHPEWSPEGRWIILNTPDGEVEGIAPSVLRFDADDPAAEPVVLVTGTSSSGGVKPMYSPDGARIAFVCVTPTRTPDGLCVMDADGSDVEVVVDDPNENENHPAWGVAGG